MHRKHEVLWEELLTHFLKVDNTKITIWLSSSSEKFSVYTWKVNCYVIKDGIHRRWFMFKVKLYAGRVKSFQIVSKNKEKKIQ